MYNNDFYEETLNNLTQNRQQNNCTYNSEQIIESIENYIKDKHNTRAMLIDGKWVVEKHTRNSQQAI